MLSSLSLLPKVKRGHLFILSGPAGSGKTTLMDGLQVAFPQLIKNVSFTTRKSRSEEINGKDYFFVSLEEFEKRQARGEFLETIELFGHHYGTSRIWVENQLEEGKHVFLVIDVQGAKKIQQHLNATSIFIKPPSLEILKKRLLDRGTEEKSEIENRLKRGEEELLESNNYDYQVINDDLKNAQEVLKCIVVAELHRSIF